MQKFVRRRAHALAEHGLDPWTFVTVRLRKRHIRSSALELRVSRFRHATGLIGRAKRNDSCGI